MPGDLSKRDSRRTEWQRRSDHDQASRLVQDDRFKSAKAEQANKQWQSEFRTAKADQTA
jgi:hypothetical protein